MSEILRCVQEDFYGRLLADAGFSDVAVILLRKDLTEQEVKRLLGTIAGRSGKVGACVLVQMPVLTVPNPDVPGPRTAIVQTLTVLEHPTINASSQGTGKSAEELAIAALQLFHHFIPFGVTQVFIGTGEAIVPEAGFEGLVGYTVQLSTFVALAKPTKVATPTISAAPATVPTTITLACATVGASIYYTTDGSYPSAANTAATLYTVPFALAVTATVRAAASKTGLQQSDVAQTTLS